MKIVKGIYQDGTVRPLEKIDILNNQEVHIFFAGHELDSTHSTLMPPELIQSIQHFKEQQGLEDTPELNELLNQVISEIRS